MREHGLLILLTILVVWSGLFLIVLPGNTHGQDMLTKNFTQNSIYTVNDALQFKELQMLVITVVANETMQPIDYIYLVVWDSPYARLYTMFTVTEKFEFATLITNPGAAVPPEERMQKGQLSRYTQAMLNETEMLQFKPNPKYSQLKLCSLEQLTESSYAYRTYVCLDLFTNVVHTESAPFMLRVQDATLTLLQIACVIGFTYYVNLKLYHIRRAGKHRYVSDAFVNPPYWPNIIPGISRKTKTNFRLWDSIWLSMVFVCVYALSIISAFAPSDWPQTNKESYVWNLKRYIGPKEIRFLIATGVVIIVNILLTIYKIYRNATREKHTKLKLSFGTGIRWLSYLFAFAIAAGATAVVMVFEIFIFPEKFTLMKKIFYGISGGGFGIAMMVYITQKPVSVSYWLHQRLTSYSDRSYGARKKRDTDDQYHLLNETSGKTARTVSTTFTFLLVLRSWILTAIWNTTLTILAFRAGRVVSRLFTATLANIIMNTEMLTTYSYVISIVGVFYKFTLDIEKPYLRLKNMIAKERGSLHMLRIMGTNNTLRQSSLGQMKSDLLLLRDRTYLMPLRWTTFAKLTEMTCLPRLTRRILLQMLVTIFALCIFYIAAKSHDTQFFARVTGNSSLIGIIAGTIMPLIPRIISYFTEAEDGMDSNMFNERLKNSIKLLERRAENNTKEKFAWPVPSTHVPFKFIIVSIVTEPDAQSDDDDDDIPLTRTSNLTTNVPLKTLHSPVPDVDDLINNPEYYETVHMELLDEEQQRQEQQEKHPG